MTRDLITVSTKSSIGHTLEVMLANHLGAIPLVDADGKLAGIVTERDIALSLAGVAGKDILLEYEPDVYEMLDLDLGKCRMAVAAHKDFRDNTDKTLRVATKFVNIAKTFYSEKCRDIDIIKLNGSIELAPILGLSDVIVDIVETGKTLIENNLEPIETIVPISARLIANKSSHKFKNEEINNIMNALAIQVEERKSKE